MERDSLTNLDNLSPLPTTTNDGTAGKLLPGSGAGDRLKRDEWSEGAVSSLLEAYESKWILRNRAKLKGHDWEDVARHVSSRENSSKSAKTQTQCKNKIESMKKRYRSESAIADSSSWPLFPRLDLLLRGTTGGPVSMQPATIPMAIPFIAPLLTLEQPPMEPPPPVAVEPVIASLPPGKGGQNSHASIAIGIINRTTDTPQEDVVGTQISDRLSDKNRIETDSSTPALYSNKEKVKSRKMKMKAETKKIIKRRIKRSYDVEIAESIKWLAETIMRVEQARLETMRDIEKMKVEAEAKRAEMDLKRIEIVANTQVEIAKIFANAVAKASVHYTAKFPASISDGEKARSMRPAMITTGKKRSASGGGGSGGSINGRTITETARAASTRRDTKQKQRAIRNEVLSFVGARIMSIGNGDLVGGR